MCKSRCRPVHHAFLIHFKISAINACNCTSGLILMRTFCLPDTKAKQIGQGRVTLRKCITTELHKFGKSKFLDATGKGHEDPDFLNRRAKYLVTLPCNRDCLPAAAAVAHTVAPAAGNDSDEHDVGLFRLLYLTHLLLLHACILL